MANPYIFLYKYIIFAVALTLSFFQAYGNDDESFYRRMLNTDILQLKKQANKYLLTQPDSAIAYLNAVAAHYSPDMSHKDKLICAQAMNNLGYLHFFYKHDPVMSYSYLVRCQSVTEETGDESLIPYLALNIANVFCFLDDYNSALPYYRKSIDAGLKTKEYEPVLTSLAVAASYISSSYSSSPQLSIKEQLPQLNQINRNEFSCLPMAEYTWSLIDGVIAWEKKDYLTAENYFKKALGQIDSKYTPDRFRLMTLTMLSNLKYDIGNYASALEYINQCLKETDDPDIRGPLYNLLHRCYEQSGNKEKAAYYLNRYVSLADTLLHSGQAKALRDIEKQNSIANFNLRLSRANDERHHLMIVVFVMLAALVIMGVLGFWLYKSRRKLQKLNEELYHQARAKISCHMSDATEESVNNKISNNSEDSDDDEKTKELVSNLRNIMETSPEIYRSDFSLDSLARLANASSRKVSLIINTRFGLNFNTFLQKYRVEEACRRLDNHERYQNHTIEAISESLGFKSRSNFIAVFRKFTGLTPSEYQKIGASRRAKGDA